MGNAVDPASWELKRDALIRESEPALIQPTPEGRLTRTLGIGLQGLADCHLV